MTTSIYKPVFRNLLMKENAGWFKKGNTSWNKNKRMNLNLKKIEKEHIKGKSILDISKELGISDRLISLRLKENNMFVRDKKIPSKYTKNKIKNTMIRKGIQPKERYSGKVWNKGLTQKDERVKNNIKGLLENRKTQVLPTKDTSIELKIQNFLKQLHIKFLTHQYIKEIEHGYQCDILIPVQKGIKKKTIIECFGDYWHKYPLGREIDIQRGNELREKGWRVIVLWENEIQLINEIQLMNVMDIKNNLFL